MNLVDGSLGQLVNDQATRCLEVQIHTAMVSGGVCPLAGGAGSLLMSSFSSLPGLKYGTFFGGTSTLSPVFGLRPLRGSRLRSRKLPNPRSSIFSPRCSASMMLLKTVSTITSECFFVRSETRDTSSTSSALVMLPPGVFTVAPHAKLQLSGGAVPPAPPLSNSNADPSYRFLKWSPRVALPVPSFSRYSSQS